MIYMDEDEMNGSPLPVNLMASKVVGILKLFSRFYRMCISCTFAQYVSHTVKLCVFLSSAVPTSLHSTSGLCSWPSFSARPPPLQQRVTHQW